MNLEKKRLGEELSLDAFPEPQRAFVEALSAIEKLMSDEDEIVQWRQNHIYINCLVDAPLIQVAYVKVWSVWIYLVFLTIHLYDHFLMTWGAKI